MSKKFKKPKPREAQILSAKEIDTYISLKYEIDNNEFWDWFFSECPWGETNFLGLHNNDFADIIQPRFMEYFNIIKQDFIFDADDESCLEIENDL